MTDTIKSHKDISGTLDIGSITSKMGDYKAEYTAERVKITGPAIDRELVVEGRKDASDIASLLLNYE